MSMVKLTLALEEFLVQRRLVPFAVYEYEEKELYKRAIQNYQNIFLAIDDASHSTC